MFTQLCINSYDLECDDFFFMNLASEFYVISVSICVPILVDPANS